MSSQKTYVTLLLQPPLKGKVVLGVDPAYRTGCKLAVVDETGKLLEVSVIYPHPPKLEMEKSKKEILDLYKKVSYFHYCNWEWYSFP